MMMRKLLPSLVAMSVLLAASLASATDPKTSLGKWMQNGEPPPAGSTQRLNMPNVMSGDTPDYGMLQTLVAKLLTKEPPAATYPKWDGFLQQAMTAAKGSDKAGVKAACKGCHDTYKAAYIADPNSPKPPASYF